DDHAHLRLGQDVGRVAADEQVGGIHHIRLILADCQRADVPATDAATDTATVLDVDWLAGAAQAEVAREVRTAVLATATGSRLVRVAAATADAAELEQVGVVEEEVALFGEEQVE